MNLSPNTRAAFVGKSAFAHKGGIHVSAVLKDSRMYEHISPKLLEINSVFWFPIYQGKVI